MSKQKFDRILMHRMLHEEKKTATEVAAFFGVSVTSICKARKVLRAGVVKNVTLENASRIVQKELDVMDQLHNINKHSKEILEDLIDKIKKKDTKTLDVKGMKDLRALALDTAAEIRQQLNFQVEIFKTLSDYQVMAEFQKEVLDVIGNASKCLDCGSDLQCMKCGKKIDLKGVIIARLKESKALRSSVQIRP
jgi:hypothetical protein